MQGPRRRGRTCPIDERARWELVAWVLGFPVVGAAILLVVAWDVASHGRGWGIGDWFFRLVWAGCIGLVLMIGLPATARKELQRRNALASPAPAAESAALPGRRRRRG